MTPHLQGTSANIRAADCGSIYIQIFVVGSDSAGILKQSADGRSRSSKVVHFDTNYTSIFSHLLVINSDLVPVLPHLEILQVFC